MRGQPKEATVRMPLPPNTVDAVDQVPGCIGRRPKVFLSFTGGKDSTLALHLLHESCDIAALVTFSPRDKPFLAHPLALIRRQAAALGIPHRVCYIDHPTTSNSDTHSSDDCVAPVESPFVLAYRSWFTEFVAKEQVDAVATGDIEDVCSGFLGRAAGGSGLVILAPIWRRPRPEILELIAEHRIQALITCVSLRLLDEGLARKLCGRVLDNDAVALLRSSTTTDGSAIDECGENGEFHTMCLDGRLFSCPVALPARLHGPALSDDARFLYLAADWE
ncbi:hypothetical protein HK405_003653 [Cladochytrium tenue]|nr:hypothetical protein HK405_003653 [Cladochytrium tenue]